MKLSCHLVPARRASVASSAVAAALCLALWIFQVDVVDGINTVCFTDTRRRLVLSRGDNDDDGGLVVNDDLIETCLQRTYTLNAQVRKNDAFEGILVAIPNATENQDEHVTCPSLVFEADSLLQSVHVALSDDNMTTQEDKHDNSDDMEGFEQKFLLTKTLAGIMEAFYVVYKNTDNALTSTQFIGLPEGNIWCKKTPLMDILGHLSYPSKDLKIVEDWLCAWTVVDINIGDHLYNQIQDTCSQEMYNFVYYHYGEHLHFVVHPDDEDSSCPSLMIHDNSYVEHDHVGVKQMLLLNQGSVFLDGSGLFLARKPLSDILHAFETASTRDDAFEIVLSNCATFILSMMKILEIEPDERFINFTTDQLAGNGKTIQRLQASDNIHRLVADPTMLQGDGREILYQLVTYYIGEKFYDTGRQLRAQLCTLCAGGLSPTGPMDEVLFTEPLCDGGRQMTCSLLAMDAASYTQEQVDNGECAGLQALGSIYCGCPEQPALDCNICPDGSLPPREFMEEATVGCPVCSRDTFGFSEPCRELILTAARLKPTDTETCENLQRFGLGDCGCPVPVPGACDLCTGGNADIPDLRKKITSTVDCEGVSRLAGGSPNPLVCNSYKTVAAEYCNCAGYEIETEPAYVCRLCGDNTPLKDTRWAVGGDVGATSCGYHEVVATVFAQLGQSCDTYRQSGQNCCLDQPLCPLCAEGEMPTADLDATLPFAFADGTPATCRKLENIIVGIDADSPIGQAECSGWHEVTSQYCGCSKRDTAVECTLCPDGSLPEDPDQSALIHALGLDAGYQQLHCSSLLRLSGSLPSDSPQCLIYQEAGISQCRCPVPPEDQGTCPLCKVPGDEIPDPDLEIMPNVDCEGIARLAEYRPAEECQAYQDVAGLYCGCPRYKKFGQKSFDDGGACRICGAGKRLSFPSELILFQDVVMSCAELELAANIDDANQCFAYQQVGFEKCCDSNTKGKNGKRGMMKKKSTGGRGMMMKNQ